MRTTSSRIRLAQHLNFLCPPAYYGRAIGRLDSHLKLYSNDTYLSDTMCLPEKADWCTQNEPRVTSLEYYDPPPVAMHNAVWGIFQAAVVSVTFFIMLAPMLPIARRSSRGFDASHCPSF